jgi:hypothetical protein
MSQKFRLNPFLAIAERSGIRAYDIEELVLDHTHLESIPDGSLDSFPNLQYLYIPFNKLTILHHLEKNGRLKLIDARSNSLTDAVLTNQTFLEELLLADNQFRDLESFLSKISHMRDLNVLDLRGNPLCQEKGYRRAMFSKFLHLRILDGLEATSHDRPPPRLLTRSLFVRPRVRSMLEYLKTRPLSDADSTVGDKAIKIRKSQEERRQKDLQEATAIARARTEAFEAAAKQKEVPLPDFMVSPTKEEM